MSPLIVFLQTSRKRRDENNARQEIEIYAKALASTGLSNRRFRNGGMKDIIHSNLCSIELMMDHCWPPPVALHI